jgi:serine/threonine protein kinase
MTIITNSGDDLKPANIKIKPAGSVKVLDFGLAKSAEQAELTPDSPAMLAVHGMIPGTAGYAAPEAASMSILTSTSSAV